MVKLFYLCNGNPYSRQVIFILKQHLCYHFDYQSEILSWYFTKSLDLVLDICHFEIWQVAWQLCCQATSHISKWLINLTGISWLYENFVDLALRYHTGTETANGVHLIDWSQYTPLQHPRVLLPYQLLSTLFSFSIHFHTVFCEKHHSSE